MMRHLKLKYTLPWLFWSVCLVCVVACGGGSAGTGGQTLSGSVSTLNGTPLAGVTITVTQTGDSAVTDSQGDFQIVTEGTPSQVDLILESSQINAEVNVPLVPESEGNLQVTLTVDPGSQAVTARVLDVLAYMVGTCDGYFENNGRVIRQASAVAPGTSCSVKVKLYADGQPLITWPIAIESKGCDPNSPWNLVVRDHIGPSAFGQLGFEYIDDDQHCFYRVAAPYEDPAIASVYTYINTFTAQSKGLVPPS